MQKYSLDYLPEAHCYLKIGKDILDIARPYSKPPDLLEETEIMPEQITDYKVAYHKSYLQKWLGENSFVPYSLKELWRIKEQCIRDLSLQVPINDFCATCR